tara:strand:+ start:1939 stop:2730 length:792 start_codon:yes stop_codon:yes gene_type:complete
MGLSVSDFTIDNASGQAVRLDIQACFKALQGQNAESSDLADSQCVAGMWFLRSDSNTLKIRGSGSSFTTVGNIDQDNLGLLSKAGGKMVGEGGSVAQIELDDAGTAAAPALSFDTDTDLGLFRKSANVMGFSSSGTEKMIFDTNGLTLQSQNDLRFADSDSSHFIALQAPSTISSNVTLTLPATDAPVSGYALISDGSGTLSWGVAGAGAQGGGSDNIFWENDQTVTTNYTITNGKNAGSFSPITIQNGVTVTVGSGETWTVV